MSIHNIMVDISEFKRGQIVGVRLTGSSVTRTASLCGVWRAVSYSVEKPQRGLTPTLLLPIVKHGVDQ